MHIGKKIKYLVEHSDIKIQRISYALGYKSPQSLYDIYKREHITTDILEKICKFFNVSIYYFFNDEHISIIETSQVRDPGIAYLNKNVIDEKEFLCARIRELERTVRDKERINELLEEKIKKCMSEIDIPKTKQPA